MADNAARRERYALAIQAGFTRAEATRLRDIPDLNKWPESPKRKEQRNAVRRQNYQRLRNTGASAETAARYRNVSPEMLWSKWSGIGSKEKGRSGFPPDIEELLGDLNESKGFDRYDGYAYRWFYFVFVKEQESEYAESLVDYNDPSEWKRRLARRTRTRSRK